MGEAAASYEVCNYTLQRKILGVPPQFLKTQGFMLLTKRFPGMRFVRGKNDQVNVMVDVNAFARDYAGGKLTSESLHRIILSNCNDRTIMMKVLGVKFKQKVVFAFRMFQRMFDGLRHPETHRTLSNYVSYGPIETTNIVVKWQIPGPLPGDFEVMSDEFGERCTWQESKIPLMRMNFGEGKRWAVNVSRGGTCTTLGVKDIGEVSARQHCVAEFFKGIRRDSTLAPTGGTAAERRSATIMEEVRGDRLNFQKSELHFQVREGRRKQRIKFFNKSESKKGTGGNHRSWAQSLNNCDLTLLRRPRLALYVKKLRSMQRAGLGRTYANM